MLSNRRDQPHDPNPNELNSSTLQPSSTRDLIMTERMIRAVNELEADAGNLSLRRAVLSDASDILSTAGFPNVKAVKSLMPDRFAAAVQPGHQIAVAMALETIAWYRYRPDPAALDLAVMYLERASLLAPADIQIVSRFALLASRIQPEDIKGLSSNPRKQKETEIGYKIRAKKALETLLDERFGVSGLMIMGVHGKDLFEHLGQHSSIDTDQLGGLFGVLSQLTLELGVFFKKEAHLHFALSSAVSQLEMLGFQRPPHHQLNVIQRLTETSPVSSEISDQREAIVYALENLSRAGYEAWSLLGKDAHEKLSARADYLLDRLEPIDLTAENGSSPPEQL